MVSSTSGATVVLPTFSGYSVIISNAFGSVTSQVATLTVLSGGFAAGRTGISILILVALVAAFCGILNQLARVLLGTPKVTRTGDATTWDGVPAMALLLGGLLVFSVWLPTPVLRLLHQAAGIIGGKP